MEQEHTGSHEGAHHEIIEHHEPTFTVRLLTYIWFIVIGSLTIKMFAFIGNHVLHELLIEIKEFFAN